MGRDMKAAELCARYPACLPQAHSCNGSMVSTLVIWVPHNRLIDQGDTQTRKSVSVSTDIQEADTSRAVL